jgi:hypothetical protein
VLLAVRTGVPMEHWAADPPAAMTAAKLLGWIEGEEES